MYLLEGWGSWAWWGQSTGPAGTREGWWLPSCANTLQSGITKLLNMGRSLRQRFYMTFSLPSKSTPMKTVPFKTVHFLVHVKICYSSTNACSTKEMRLYFAFYFSRLYFFLIIYETEKKMKATFWRKKRGNGTIIYKPAVWQLQFHIQKEWVSSYMATYCKLPYSTFCFATFQMKCSYIFS